MLGSLSNGTTVTPLANGGLGDTARTTREGEEGRTQYTQTMTFREDLGGRHNSRQGGVGAAAGGTTTQQRNLTVENERLGELQLSQVTDGSGSVADGTTTCQLCDTTHGDGARGATLHAQ